MEAVDEPNFQRLDQPERCPDDWYQLMLRCWAADPSDRRKFSEMFLITLNQVRQWSMLCGVEVELTTTWNFSNQYI